jgi:hypothetical protein
MGQEGEYDEEHTDCLLSLTAQMDPKGWIWRSFGFQHEMLSKVSIFLNG